MELVDAETLEDLLAALSEPPVRAPGGSAGNTTFALARMGMPWNSAAPWRRTWGQGASIPDPQWRKITARLAD